MPVLKIISGVNAGQTFDLAQEETLLGRDTFCQVHLPVRTVSRQHARILRTADEYSIEDLESVNGTCLNGHRVEGRVRLQLGDKIRLHDVVLGFLSDTATEAGESDMADESSAEEGSEAESGGHIFRRVDARSDPGDELEENPWFKLRAVLELTKNLGSSLEMDEVLPRILDGLFEIFPQTERGYILQASPSGGGLEPIAIKHRGTESDTISPLGGTVVTRVMSEASAFLSSDGIDDRSEGSGSVLDQDVRSVMCAPLMGAAREPLGVIHIETSDPDQPFVQRDLDVLISVGNLAGRAADAARMHETLLMLDRQKRELAMARDVQLHFLPAHRPIVEGYAFFDFYRAAQGVAGDYYDYIELPDGRLGMAVGDVAGKGISAALLMARLCSEVRYCLLATETPARAVERLNQQLTDQLVDDRFVTLVLLVLDPVGHQLTVVNAGHAPPFRRDATTSEVVLVGAEQVGMPLGIDRSAEYAQSVCAMRCGDVVLSYTDGINEAMGPSDELYGYRRIEEVVGRTSPSATHIGKALVADVQSFTEGVPQHDDMCLLCFERTAMV